MDPLLANPFLLEQEFQNLMLKELFQLPYVYLRQHIEPAVRHEAAVSDKAMEMGVEVDEIPEGLDGDHDPRNGSLLI